jgi:hypothetical protein
MALKKYNPTSPGQRNLVTVDRSDLYKGKPVKKLTQGLTSSVSNMILTGQLLSPLLLIQMVIRVIFWLRNGYLLVIKSSRHIGQISSQGMLCHYHPFQLERLFTMLN